MNSAQTPSDSRNSIRPYDQKQIVRFSAFAAVILITLILIWLPRWRSARSVRLTITAGSASGLRHTIAESLIGFTEARRVDLSCEPTSGSRDALDKVDAGIIDMALTQGGLADSLYPHIRQVAVLHVEPLHLLVKPPVDDGEPEDHYTLADLSERIGTGQLPAINLSAQGSGTNALANDVLAFFGLEEGKDYQPTYLSYSQLMNPQLADEELPDAAFMVSSLPSPVAKYLIVAKGYRPVELPMADAFRIDWTPSVGGGARREVVRQRIEEATIPAFTYQVSPPVPKQGLNTLGTRLQLVAHEDTSPEAVERVIEAVYESSFATVSDPVLSVKLLQNSAEYELHEGAASYLQKKTPIITEQAVELTEQLLAILGTVCGGLLFVWQALLFTRRRRRDRQFLACIERVGQIEQRTLEYESDKAMGVDTLIGLQGELSEIKSDMVRQFQSGDIDGADTLSSFLMHVNDANENLTRLILHERSPKEEN